MDINDLVLNEKALAVVDKGEWMPAGDEAPDVEFLVTGWQAEASQKLLKQKMASQRLKNRGKEISDEQGSRITKEVLIEETLKDWRGIKSDGKELPYSKDLARKLITARGGQRFSGMVLGAAQRLDGDANAYVEEVTKN